MELFVIIIITFLLVTVHSHHRDLNALSYVLSSVIEAVSLYHCTQSDAYFQVCNNDVNDCQAGTKEQKGKNIFTTLSNNWVKVIGLNLGKENNA